MSSSFVKDCSDVSAAGSTNSSKTVIIIVNNDTGNVALDGQELQNVLASHGADASQVSVVHMGAGAAGLPVQITEDVASNATVLGPDGYTHVNVSVEGFPGVAVEDGSVQSSGYAELPLDADAIQRLESMLESDEAREILGEPLLDMVTNPDDLIVPLEQLMQQGLLLDKGIDGSGHSKNLGYRRLPPTRRSQRQMDKAEREEVIKILAENQKMLKQQQEELSKVKEKDECTLPQKEGIESQESEKQSENPVSNAECNEDGKKVTSAKVASKGKESLKDKSRVGAKKIGKSAASSGRPKTVNSAIKKKLLMKKMKNCVKKNKANAAEGSGDENEKGRLKGKGVSGSKGQMNGKAPGKKTTSSDSSSKSKSAESSSNSEDSVVGMAEKDPKQSLQREKGGTKALTENLSLYKDILMKEVKINVEKK